MDAGRHDGFAELRAARRGGLGLVAAVAMFSVAVNLLNLTGPLFMMQVYDRVLASRSVPTLVALFLLVAFLFLMMGMIDLARNRLMSRVAVRFQERMETRVFQAALAGGTDVRQTQGSQPALRDLESLRHLAGSPALMAIFDLPWAPMFLAALWLFHPLLGGVATLGGLVLVLSTWLNQSLTRRPLQDAVAAGQTADRAAALYHAEGGLIGALGMRQAVLTRWRWSRDQMADAALRAAERGAVFTVFSRTFRLFLQSALLAAGAWLVLRQELTPGAMIASSVLMGRALAPVDQLVGGWPVVQRALDGWTRLGGLLSRHPPVPARTSLPRQAARLEVANLTVIPPGHGTPTLKRVGFTLAPGQALGVIGPSGAGKSTLARALIGAWPAAAGSIRLDGATLEQYDPDVLGQLIGYLPQQVTLFDGTVAENIARLDPQPCPKAVVRAARAAAAHRMILDLPRGYDTHLSQAGARLSGGQIQRIGLARALYGDPVLFVLDEPNSHLDKEGTDALNFAIRAIKARGGAVFIMAHRLAALAECELLLMMERGERRALGPRDWVLRSAHRKAATIEAPHGADGGAA